jgi:hypothetical protein
MLRYFTLTDALLIRLKYIESMTHQQISGHLRVTESRVSQRHADIVALLRVVVPRDKLLELIGGRAA